MKALCITEHTLIGTSDERPSFSGNCFSVKADDGKYYRIVNFNMENLEALIELGLKWPIECEALADGRCAAVMDGRIGERWYSDRYCEICCPEELLPITQLQRHKRECARGARVEGDGYVTYHLQVKAAFP